MPTSPVPPARRLSLVPLEDRLAPATFTVTTAADNGNDASPTLGSLRAAILAANAAPGADTVAFNLDLAGGAIRPTAALPAVTDTVTIDGGTQPGFTNAPLVVLDGSAAGGGANGLVLRGHNNSAVRGLVINRFAGNGVVVDGGSGHTLTRNFIGLAATGQTAAANGADGVLVTNGASAVQIGGNTDATRNVLSGNAGNGITFTNGASGSLATGNFIGTTGDGLAAAGNGGSGVAVTGGARTITIGGVTAGTGNVIAGNAGHGVRVADAATLQATVVGNRVGLGFSGQAVANGGDGVRLEAAAGTAQTPANGGGSNVRNNTVSGNKGDGIAVRDATRFARLEGNAVFVNGGLGIRVDPGANAGLAAPTVADAKPGAGGLTATGTVTGLPNTKYQVEVFGSPVADPTGFGEGQTPLGAVTVTTDASGAAPFSFTAANTSAGKFVTATATAVDTGDTSAFSNAFATTTGPQVTTLLYPAGADRGGSPLVTAYNVDGSVAFTKAVFEDAFTGGVRVAAADFNADGVQDIVVGSGPGRITAVRVIDGKTQATLFDVSPFEASFTGGVYVAAGDLTGDGRPDVVVTPDEGGGPVVVAYDGTRLGEGAASQVVRFFGIEDTAFRGGARPAVGDVNRDGRADLVVAAGFGGGPRVSVWSGKSLDTTTQAFTAHPFGDFFAFELSLRNGVFITSGDMDGDGFADLVFGGGPGGGPRVRAVSGRELTVSGEQADLFNFFAGDPNTRGGIRVAARPFNSDRFGDLVTGEGPGATSKVSFYNGIDLGSDPEPAPSATATPFGGFTGGVFVG